MPALCPEGHSHTSPPSGASCGGGAASEEFPLGLSVSAMLTSHTIVAAKQYLGTISSTLTL